MNAPHLNAPFLSVPQLTSVVRAAPMPQYVKEQILDQVLGHHDDLNTLPAASKSVSLLKSGAPKNGRSKSERVAEARQIGGFIFKERLPSGDEVFEYCKITSDCKSGVPAYELTARDGQPVHCTCPDFRFHVLRDPDYCCKHCDLFAQQDHADALVADYAKKAAAWATAACWFALGRITQEEADAAYARFIAARDAARKVVKP